MAKIPVITKTTPTIVSRPQLNHSVKNITKPDTINREVNAIGLAGLGIGVSTFLADFFKTQKSNFFKFGIDAKTQVPYEPDCFQTAAAVNLYAGNDVLVTAPTGTGKTAIAQYVISKNLEEGKRTFYTTPLKALSNEKFLNFQKIYGKDNVGLLTGDLKINPTAPIVIMTTEVYRNMAATEKFNKNSNYGKGIPDNLATVIFDELQYLGDVDRGGIWEQAIMFTPKDVQILSLSATIGNNKDINNWINSIKGNRDAVIVEPSENSKDYLKEVPQNKTVLINVPPENRHVPLQFVIEHVAAEISLPRGGTKKQKIMAKKEAAQKSQSIMAKPRDDSYKAITKKLYDENKLPAIYFVFSKKDCKHLLKFLSQESELLTTEKEREEIAAIIKRYLDEGVYLGESLNTDALMKGYAIHNAGLLPSQKTLIEELFQKKLVKVVLATETLSAGLNMPAKTTVISSPRKPASTFDNYNDHRRNLTPNEFHQMAGRAGRRGIDTAGYCYTLSCNPIQSKFFGDIINSSPNSLQSSLELEYSFITRYLSEFNDEDELTNILANSLYVYNPETTSFDVQKINELMTNYKIKKEILKKEEYINENDCLTLKGNLITLLNGYEQIPIINMVTNKTFANLNSKEIAGVIGALANLELEAKEDIPEKPVELRNVYNNKLSKAVINLQNEILKYNSEIRKLHPDKELKIDTNTVSQIYTWAAMNESVNNSTANWKDLVKGEINYGIKDEGSLFKALSLTIDLIKQLIEISEKGKEISKTTYEKEYFNDMTTKLREALNLIQREPVNNSIN